MRRFHVAWWAYSFPLSVLALASIEYAQEVKGRMANSLVFVLVALSVLVSLGLLVFTALNTGHLLPNDDPIISLPPGRSCMKKVEKEKAINPRPAN